MGTINAEGLWAEELWGVVGGLRAGRWESRLWGQCGGGLWGQCGGRLWEGGLWYTY